MKKIILEVRMQYVINEKECPKYIFNELYKKETITSNDIGVEKYITNKTADWLAEHTDNNNNGSFISYNINTD